MSSEDDRFTVLLEEMHGQMRVLAEAQVAGTAHLARVDQRLDRLESGQSMILIRLDRLESRLDLLEGKFDLFAADTRFRLDRLDSHVGLDGKSAPRPRRRKPKA